MTQDHSVTRLIHALRGGDDDAANAIWQRYFEKLTRLARLKLTELPTREADEEDVVLSAMQSFFGGAAAGRFPKLENRDDLWKLLVVITARKVSTYRKRLYAQKRGLGKTRGESVFELAGSGEKYAGIENVVGNEPTPEFAAEFAETCRNMLDQLGEESLRTVAELRLQGYTNSEIAEQLGVSRRSIERKLARIRSKWSPETDE